MLTPDRETNRFVVLPYKFDFAFTGDGEAGREKKTLPCPVSKETFAGIGVCLLSRQQAQWENKWVGEGGGIGGYKEVGHELMWRRQRQGGAAAAVS